MTRQNIGTKPGLRGIPGIASPGRIDRPANTQDPPSGQVHAGSRGGANRFHEELPLDDRVGKKIPPIATLFKVAKALEVDISTFFEQKNPKDRFYLVKREEREVVVRDGTLFGYRYEAIASTKGRKRMDPFVITLPPESEEKSLFDHEGEELFYVLEGEVRFYYGDKMFLLKEGDCIYFDSSVPHRGEGMEGGKSRALVVVSPP